MIRVLSVPMFLCAVVPAHAQSVGSVCLALASSGLIDTASTDTLIDNYSNEFDAFCDTRSSRSESFSSMSASFRARYGAFGARASGGQSERNSEEYFEQVCSEGSGEFRQYLEASTRNSNGSALAARVTECAALMTGGNIEQFVGTARVNETDDMFVVSIQFTSGRLALPYTLTRVVGDFECFTDNTREVSAVDNISILSSGEVSFLCAKNPGMSAVGSLTFSLPGGVQSREVAVNISSRDVEMETASEIERRVSEIVAQLQGQIVDARAETSASVERLNGQITALGGRTLQCRTYTVGNGNGGVREYRNSVTCARPEEVVVSCRFGSNHASHNTFREGGLAGCRSHFPNTDWAGATCCTIE